MKGNDEGIHKSNMQEPRAYRETRFRTPLVIERELGLWVDRVGMGNEGSRGTPLRILGQYAAVAVTSGEGIYRSPGTGEFGLHEGDVVILLPRTPAAYWPEPSWRTCWVVWNGPKAEQLEQLGYVESGVPVVRHAAPAVARIHAELQALMQREDRASVLSRMQLVLALIGELYRAQVIGRQSHAVHELGERVVGYVQRHYALDLRVDDMAREFGLSEGHFRRLFKAYSGQSPNEYLTAVRIARAKELLSAGASIKETADQVGYNNAFYFMRVFRKIAGQPPGQFASQQHTH